MRILIDLQACQSTGSRHRGIGRYSLALAKAMVRQAGGHEIWLLMSSLFPDTIPGLRATFADLIPEERMVTWFTPGPVAELIPANAWRCRTAEYVREQAIVSLRPDIVHVTSLFEGSGDDAVVSIGHHPVSTPSAVTLYDLIPLVYEKQYLRDPAQRAWYFRKLGSLRKADLLLAISESSRQEGIALLDLPPHKVINISSAVDAHFQPHSGADDELQTVRQRYGLIRPYLMYTGGIDVRKNIDALIQAYAGLAPALRAQYQLAIVCSVHAPERERLQALAIALGMAADDVILTGFVPDADLPLLYQACTLFVFPSWHEGFGLPALEAMSCGVPVIAANGSSLPEVLGCTDALFDPRDVASITAKMTQVLNDTQFASYLRQHGLMQAKKFSWDASARTAIQAFEQHHEHNTKKANKIVSTNTAPSSASVVLIVPNRHKLKLAYVSPLPPIASGIADYSAELIPALAEYYDITLIAEQAEISDGWLSGNFAIHDSQWFLQHADRFDRVIYHFGNSPAHAFMYALAAHRPGVLILHDFFLSDSQAHLELSGDIPGLWSNQLYASHGYQALFRRRDPGLHTSLVRDYPCSTALIRQAEGLIVHSAYAEHLAQFWCGDTPARKQIPLLRRTPAGMQTLSDHSSDLISAHTAARTTARKVLGLQEHDILICSFGVLGPSKLNHALLQAWLASAWSEQGQCQLIFVGQEDKGDYGRDLRQAMMTSDKAERVRITGFTDMTTFRHYLQAADIAVQLRSLARGETSAAVLDCMAHGLPVIVNKNGSMAELPSDCLIALEDQFDIADLQQKIELLLSDPALRTTLGQRARDYVQHRHHPAVVAKEYAQAIETFSITEPSARMHHCIAAIADIDVPNEAQPGEQELEDLASCLSQNSDTVGQPCLWLDVSVWAAAAIQSETTDVLPILDTLMQQPGQFRIEPVRSAGQRFRYARSWTCQQLQLPPVTLPDDIVHMRAGDVLVTLTSDVASSRPTTLIDADMTPSIAMLVPQIIGVRQYTLQLVSQATSENDNRLRDLMVRLADIRAA